MTLRAVECEATPRRPPGERHDAFLVTMDAALRVVGADTAFLGALGCRRVDLRGTEFCDLVDPTGRERVRTDLERLAVGATPSVRQPDVPIVAEPGFRAELLGTAVGRGSRRGRSIVAVIAPDRVGDVDDVLAHAPHELSEVDARLLEGIAVGSTTEELAATLYLSRSGVEYRLTALLRRLGAANRPALVAKAFSLGLLSVGTWPPRVSLRVAR